MGVQSKLKKEITALVTKTICSL